MNEDLSFIMKREMDIKMEGDYIYMSIRPKIWKDICKAARSKYPFPREYNQSRIQEDKRTIPGCEALKWNRAYAIDALGLLTMSKGQGGNKAGVDMEVAVKVEIRVEVAMCLQVDNTKSMAFLAVPVVVLITDKVVAALMAWAAVLRLWLVFIHTKNNSKENRTLYKENEYGDELAFTYNEQSYSGFEEFQYGSDNSVSLQYPENMVFLPQDPNRFPGSPFHHLHTTILRRSHLQNSRGRLKWTYQMMQRIRHKFITLDTPTRELLKENNRALEDMVNAMFLSHEIGRSSRIDDEVVQDERQRDDNDLQDERQDQPKEEEVEPRRCKRERTKKSFRPDFVSFMVKNEPTSYRKVVTSLEWLNGMKPLKVK
ncbi:hypothetical protein Tco_0709882 [Tanacetum coccineum]